MFYDFSVHLPPNTRKDKPLVMDAVLTHGVIHRVEVGFPSGCAGLVHLQVLQGASQIWPSNPGGTFNTNGYTIAFHEYFTIDQPPFTLTLVGWNVDVRYPHTLEVRFGLLPAHVLLPEHALAKWLNTLARRFRLR